MGILKHYMLAKGAEMTVLQLANFLVPFAGVGVPILKEMLELMLIPQE